MILAGKQASHRLKRERLSPTITPGLSLFYVLEDHSGWLRDSSLIIGHTVSEYLSVKKHGTRNQT